MKKKFEKLARVSIKPMFDDTNHVVIERYDETDDAFDFSKAYRIEDGRISVDIISDLMILIECGYKIHYKS